MPSFYHVKRSFVLYKTTIEIVISIGNFTHWYVKSQKVKYIGFDDKSWDIFCSCLMLRARRMLIKGILSIRTIAALFGSSASLYLNVNLLSFSFPSWQIWSCSLKNQWSLMSRANSWYYKPDLANLLFDINGLSKFASKN